MDNAERRVAVRTTSSQQAPCHFATLDARACRWAQVRDVSRTGISLCLNHEFMPGETLLIELPSKTLQAGSVSARVVHVRAQTDGTWIVGCAFQQPLSDEEFQALV